MCVSSCCLADCKANPLTAPVVSASGYLQGGFWDGNPAREEYGTRIRETTMGALHDHVINVSACVLQSSFNY